MNEAEHLFLVGALLLGVGALCMAAGFIFLFLSVRAA